VRILGQWLQTAIIAEAHDGLVVIDQHRAEERVLYEKLLRRADKGSAQELLMPVEITVLHEHEAPVRGLLRDLASHGFGLEWHGSHRLVVRAVPAGVPAHAVEGLVDSMHGGELPGQGALDSVLTSVACRSAIRRGAQLTVAEMEQLVGRLAACTVQSLCPHGSPIVARIGSSDLARHFSWP
jgi:DNA mismatch repair protein MutL